MYYADQDHLKSSLRVLETEKLCLIMQIYRIYGIIYDDDDMFDLINLRKYYFIIKIYVYTIY